MNLYLALASGLEWREDTWARLPARYTAFLSARLHDYAEGSGPIAQELRSVIRTFSDNEVRHFVNYPYVSDLLHPRTRLRTDESLASLAAYALSYLVGLQRLEPKYSLIFMPPEYFCPRPFPSPPASVPVYWGERLSFPGMPSGNILRPYLGGDRQIQESRITRAAEILSEVGSLPLSFTCSGTSLLCTTSEIEEANRFGSASFRGFAGLNLIINPHLVSTYTIADALLHEAIHSHLYQLEPGYHDFFDDKSASEKTVTSPWTGNTITRDNLAQACFVWFGLLRFWQQASASTVPELVEYAIARTRYIAAGFQHLDLSAVTPALCEPLREALRWIEAAALGG